MGCCTLHEPGVGSHLVTGESDRVDGHVGVAASHSLMFGFKGEER